MYSVVIADDEINICEGLKSVLEKHCPELQISGLFFNGRELLEFLQSNHTDIIITDIRMPETNGLQIAEFVYENNRKSHVIITTGYKEFEYAQKAITYKVDGFFAKPFAFKELIQRIREIENIIDKEIQSAIKEDNLYLNNWQILKNQLVSIYNGNPTCNAAELSIFFRSYIALNDCKCYEITYTNIRPDIPIPERAVADFGEWISETEIRCFVKSTPHQFCCVVLYKDEADIDTIITEFIDSIQLHFNCMLHYSYLSFSDISLWSRHCINRKYMEQYFTNIGEKGHKHAVRILTDGISAFTGDQLLSLYQYIVTLSDPDFIKKRMNTHQITPQDIADLLETVFNNTRTALSKSDSLIQSTMRYIEQNYRNPGISLVEIANHLCVNPNYLGQTIKKKTGKRFVDLLLQTRMEQAKYLLIQTDMPVKEIAYAVGYNQVPYFRQLFKNYYGITPTNYKTEERNKV